mmetsp:Transcript_1595/g.4178  ORF Transcript_1595/g.4178 Transcript_1595/m.4178 type:complete len:241 (+) Transcript_1595:94-816(+)
MSFQGLAQPAPTVEEAIAEAPIESKAVKVKPAEIAEEPEIEAAPRVSAAVVNDHEIFAPKIPPQKASGLSVAQLKKQGTDFESEAAVIKGRVKKDILKKILPFIYDERDFVSYGEIRRYVFVKGNCIFIFGDKTNPKPLYVIELGNIRAEVEDVDNPDKHSYSISPQPGTNKPAPYLVTVLLKDISSGKQAYQITFDTRKDKSMIKRFMDVLRSNAKHYGGDVVGACVVDAKVEKVLSKS